MGGGSDRAADRWREDYRIAGAEALDLHHLYRAMAWLGEELPATGAGRPHAVRPALHQGSDRGAAVRPSARSVQPARPGVHGHHQSLLRRRGWPDARPPRLQQGPPAGPPADDPRSAHRWRRAAGLLGDVAGQHGRRHDPHPGDRPAAPALRHRPGLRRRRSRHDQCRDRGRARGAQPALSFSACASAATSWCASSCSTDAAPVRAADDRASAAKRSTTRPRR